MVFVVRTTFRFASAALTILKPCFADVVNHSRPRFALSLPMQNFAFRTNTEIPSPADTGMRSVATDSAGWLRVVHTAYSPENRSGGRPFSRYSLAWCSRDPPPSFVVFYSAAVPCDPLLAINCSQSFSTDVDQCLLQSGVDGARFDYGYRGTPILIDLGFDATEVISTAMSQKHAGGS